jgi:hypothetical protein
MPMDIVVVPFSRFREKLGRSVSYIERRTAMASWCTRAKPLSGYSTPKVI